MSDAKAEQADVNAEPADAKAEPAGILDPHSLALANRFLDGCLLEHVAKYLSFDLLPRKRSGLIASMRKLLDLDPEDYYESAEQGQQQNQITDAYLSGLIDAAMTKQKKSLGKWVAERTKMLRQREPDGDDEF